jgi:hypothetical protein
MGLNISSPAQEYKVCNNTMLEYSIKVHTPGYQHKKPHVFAQSKGYNTGKPLKEEIPNCFVIILKTEEEAQKMFFMLDGLWRSQIFRRQLIGSVVPFLRIGEFTKTINRYWRHIHENDQRVVKLVAAFDAIEKLQKEIDSLNKFLNLYKSVAYIDVLKTQSIDF